MQIDLSLTVGQVLATFVTLLLAIFAGAWAIGTLVAKQFAARLEDKFRALQESVKSRDTRLERLEDQLRALERQRAEDKLEATRTYMTQEERIELAASLKGRMDGLASQMERLLDVART